MENNLFTEKGLAYFTCLFLEKKEAYLLLKKLFGFRDSREPKYQATFEAFCVYGIQMPLVRLESTEVENALTLDMLNELQRCPADLFDLLREEDRNKFKIDIGVEDSEELEPKVALKRKEDRFTYHILSYLDQTEAFKALRFYLDLGNFHYKIYDKIIDKESRIRRLTKKITAFGRLDEIQKAVKPDAWKALEKSREEFDENEEKPYIVETQPHYHLFEDNIGIKISTNTSDMAQYPDVVNAVKKSGEPKTEMPDFWLSRDELMSMTFYHVLQKENLKFKSVENIIKQHRQNMISLFKKGDLMPLFEEEIPKFKGIIEPAKHSQENPELIRIYQERKAVVSAFLKDKFQVDFHDVPDLITDYLMGLESIGFENVAETKIANMVEKTDRMLKSLARKLDTKERKNKIGRKEHREVKAGDLGEFLARDFLLFQPTTDQVGDAVMGKGKITGLAFQVLQAKLAFFGRDKDSIPDVLREFKLIDSENSHPFLSKVLTFKSKGIISFYEDYLKQRKAFLQYCLQEKNYRNYHWLHLNKNLEKEKQGFFKRLTQNYLSLPIYLPRGLFIEPLKEICSKHENQNLQTSLKTDRVNTIFVLQQYFKHVLEDAPQGFYDWKRSYKIFNRFNDDRQSKFKKLPEAYFSTHEFEEQTPAIKKWINSKPEINDKGENERANRLGDLKDFQKNEKYIRHLKAQDMVLFLAAKDLLKKTGDAALLSQNIDQVKLANITPKSETSILSTQIPFEIELTFQRIDKRTFQKKIYQKALKIKNYGDFRRFVKDRRLPNLMEYLKDERIERADLEKELEAYHNTRIEVFRIVQAFETLVHTHLREDLQTNLRIPVGKSEHEGILWTYFEHEGMDKQAIERIKNLRNAFAHNQYPEAKFYAEQVGVDTIDIAQKQFIASQFLQIAKDIYGNFSERLLKRFKENLEPL